MTAFMSTLQAVHGTALDRHAVSSTSRPSLGTARGAGCPVTTALAGKPGKLHGGWPYRSGIVCRPGPADFRREVPRSACAGVSLAVMDRLRRWLLCRSTGRASTKRPWGAGLVAAGLAGAALLLAFLFHLGAAAVAAAILATVPTAYLTWKTLPTIAKKPPRGRPVTRWKPVELGVHQVIGGGPMPTYIRRPHDDLLGAVLNPAVSASRLVVVRGGSSTGKTRAACEAVTDLLADWQLDYPLDVAALKARLDAGSRPARCYGWASCASTPTPPAARRCWAAWSTCSTVRAVCSSPACGPSSGPPTPRRRGRDPGPPIRLAPPGGCSSGCPELTGDPAQIDPARGGVIDVPARFTTAAMTAAAAHRRLSAGGSGGSGYQCRA